MVKKDHIVQTAFLELLHAGLWEADVKNKELFPLLPEQWHSLWLLAKKQTVAGLIYQGLQHLPETCWPDDADQVMEWAVYIDQIERENRLQNQCIARQVSLFETLSIKPVLQKGQGVAIMYENPLLRECGDIDWYFPDSEQASKALSLMQKQGCVPRKRADASYSYRYHSVTVEHHDVLIDVSSPFAKRQLKAMERNWGFEKMKLAESETTVWVPVPMMNLLLLNIHILKHAMGRGIGIRQFCDLARAYSYYKDRYNPEELRSTLKNIGLLKWTGLLHQFLVTVVGMPQSLLPFRDYLDSDVTGLRNLVFKGGNFGLYHSHQAKTKSRLSSKIAVLRAYMAQLNFSRTYASSEVGWAVWNLIKGQFK